MKECTCRFNFPNDISINENRMEGRCPRHGWLPFTFVRRTVGVPIPLFFYFVFHFVLPPPWLWFDPPFRRMFMRFKLFKAGDTKWHLEHRVEPMDYVPADMDASILLCEKCDKPFALASGSWKASKETSWGPRKCWRCIRRGLRDGSIYKS